MWYMSVVYQADFETYKINGLVTHAAKLVEFDVMRRIRVLEGSIILHSHSQMADHWLVQKSQLPNGTRSPQESRLSFPPNSSRHTFWDQQDT